MPDSALLASPPGVAGDQSAVSHRENSARRTTRVVHLVPARFGIDGVMGGAERFAHQLARHMAEEVPTRLVTFGESDSSFCDRKLTVRVIGRAWRVRGQSANPIAPGLLRELRWADVVHCHQRFVLAASVAALFCRLSGRRVFVTDLGGGGWDLSLYLNTDRWFHGHLHLSEYSRAGYGHTGRPWAHVISGGVDTQFFSPSAPPRERRAALYVGRILPHKGIDVLIRALPPDMPLTIIGRAYDARYLEDLRQLASAKSVDFNLECGDDDLVAAYRRAACVILPSVQRTLYGERVDSAELLGQTLLEAMACATPVICSALGGMPEIVDDGVNGFVVPPGDCDALRQRLRWFAEHPDEAAAMGAAGRAQVVAKFTWPRVVRRCLEIYRSV
ncbi:MAG TPA: glycosyltransferase family 4 protein [Candidatus Binataceae bacterium]|nr:glycosyltransferase family 4 protein [Candidatus Binataceae bacterium]